MSYIKLLKQTHFLQIILGEKVGIKLDTLKIETNHQRNIKMTRGKLK